MSRITFNIAAKCDKAGRAQNQDNYWVCPNLEKIGDTSAVGNDTDVELSSQGALLVVADGMGGMKSGEKASEFVIEGIKKKFANIPPEILSDDNAIVSFIKNAIIDSDKMIKAYAKEHRESEGMGSTIVLVWLLGEKAYCGWCGDSRIYCYNPQNSLVRLSHDHSYVQSLVDDGKISEDEAFDHPDGNIITRSLGDSGEPANPETKIYPIHRRDVFMLCSDGLCGLLNDKQIEEVLADNCTSSEDALKALWAKGQQEGWSDNATVEVACVTDGGVTPTRKAVGYDEGKPKPVMAKGQPVKKDTNVMPNFWQANKIYIFLLAIVAIVAASVIWFFSGSKEEAGSSNQEFNVEVSDTPQRQTQSVEQPEQSQAPAANNTPQKPTRTEQPQKPDKPAQNNNTAAGNAQNVVQQVESAAQPARHTVTDKYKDLLVETYNRIPTVKKYISNAQKLRHFTNEESQLLERFVKDAKSLVNDPKDEEALNDDMKKMLAEVRAAAADAVKAQRSYKVYDEEPEQSEEEMQQQQQHQGPQGPSRRQPPVRYYYPH